MSRETVGTGQADAPNGNVVLFGVELICGCLVWLSGYSSMSGTD